MSLLICILIGFLIGWLARKDSTRNTIENELRDSISRQLERSADHEADQRIADGMRKAARNVLMNPLASEEAHYSQHAAAEAVRKESSVPAPERSAAHSPRKPAQELDSASVLLYFGAFLMVAGVGLFVGLSDFSGGVKTVAVLVLALTLYSAGLLMHRSFKKLKPAAVTLTAIGLICLPLTGVAAHFYIAGGLSGAWVWFLTSLVSLALYAVALLHMRQSLIGYMSVFMCLSLWLSIVSVIHAPLYFFGWAMIVLGMLYLLAVSYFRLWPEVEAPLSVSAAVMVPTALLMTLLFGYPAISLQHQGITVLLATAFYALATWQERGTGLRLTYLTLSNVLAPLAAYMLVVDWSHSQIVTAWIVDVVVVLQIALSSIWRRSQASWYQSTLIVTGTVLTLSTLTALPLLDGSWVQFAWLLGFVMAVGTVTALWSRSVMHAILGLAALVSLPLVVGYLACKPDLPVVVMSGWYVALGAALLAVGPWMRRFEFIELTRLAYIFALLLALVIGLGGFTWVPMAASVAVGLVASGAAYYEKTPAALYGATILGVVGAIQALNWQGVAWHDAFAVTVSSLGAGYYLVSKSLQKAKSPPVYVEPWLLSGIVTLYIGALGGLVVNGVNWPSTISLALAGLITAYESIARKQVEGGYVGAAVIVAALQLAMYKVGLREWQLYWYMWALYVVVLTYIRREVAGIAAVAFVTGGGLAAGLYAHGLTDLVSVSVISSLVAAGFYLVGKLHLLLPDRKRWEPFIEAWSVTGLVGLYLMSSLPFWLNVIVEGSSAYTWNAAIFMLAGALTCYEAYVRHSRGGLYMGAGISVVGLEWLLYTQHVHNVQIYTHLWIGYFAVLAWLGSREKRDDEKQLFTILALSMQTIPLAWQALAGDENMGLLLLFESVAVLLIGLWLRYRLVAWWGLSVAVGSVLYQLRAYQFFVLVLLGAGIIALGVFSLIKQDKKK